MANFFLAQRRPAGRTVERIFILTAEEHSTETFFIKFSHSILFISSSVQNIMTSCHDVLMTNETACVHATISMMETLTTAKFSNNHKCITISSLLSVFLYFINTVLGLSTTVTISSRPYAQLCCALLTLMTVAANSVVRSTTAAATVDYVDKQLN